MYFANVAVLELVEMLTLAVLITAYVLNRRELGRVYNRIATVELEAANNRDRAMDNRDRAQDNRDRAADLLNEAVTVKKDLTAIQADICANKTTLQGLVAHAEESLKQAEYLAQRQNTTEDLTRQLAEYVGNVRTLESRFRELQLAVAKEKNNAPSTVE